MDQDKTLSEPDQPRKPNMKRMPRWARVFTWASASFVAICVLLLVTVSILLNNARFHQYAITSTEKQLGEVLGVPVEIQNFTLHLSTLSLDIYGITVHGATPYADPPLLRLNHAHAGVRIVSFLQRTWYLDNVQIDRPVVWIIRDAHGVSNIPVFKSSSSGGNTSIFDLGIRHAVLDKGEVYYNDRKSAIGADLHNVEFRASFNALVKRYSGKLSYSDGHLYTDKYQPIPHDLIVEFDADPDTFHLTHSVLKSGNSSIQLTATLQDYNHPKLMGKYDVVVDGGEARKLLHIASVPTGSVHTAGSLEYEAIVGRSLLSSVMVSGELSSDHLNLDEPSVHMQIKGLSARYALDHGNGMLQQLHARLLGGELTGDGAMTAIDTNPHSKINIALRGISLAELRRIVAPSSMPKGVHLDGLMNAKADAAWGKTMNDLVAHADASITGKVTGKPGDAHVVPLESIIHGTYMAAREELAVKDSYVRTMQTMLNLNGTVSKESSLGVQLECNDLAEVETIADIFREPTSNQPPQPLGLAGRASFQGVARGSTATPDLSGQLTAADVHVMGSSWRSLHTSVEVNPSMVHLGRGELEPGTRGRVTFSGGAALSKWAFSKTSPIDAVVDVSQLDVGDIEKVVGQQVPVTGVLNASVKLHGTMLDPSGNGNLSLTHAIAYGEPVQLLKLTFSGTGNEVQGELGVQLAAGNVESKFSVRSQERSYSAQLSTAGIHLAQLATLKNRNVDAKGLLSLTANGSGTFDRPQGVVKLQIPRLDIQGQTVTDIALNVQVADRIGTLQLTSSAANTSIRASGKVQLEGDYLADALIDTQAIPLQPLLAAYAPEQAADITGQTELHATLHGPLKDHHMLEAHLTIPVLKLGYGKSIELAAASPIHVDYKNDLVQVQRSVIRGTDTDLQFQGSIPTVAGNTPMSLLLQGTIDLKLAQLLAPDIRSSGKVQFNINSTGASSGPDIGGDVKIVDANFSSADLPVGLQHANGVLTLTKDHLNVSKFQGTVGSGTLTAQGGIAYRPSLQFDLGVNARGVRVLYPQGMRENVDADLRLAGSADNAMLNGNVRLSDLFFTNAFDFNNFIGQFSGGVSTPPSRGFSQNLQLNIGVRSENEINLVSRTLSVAGSANLQVRGTAAQPVILGRVNVNNGDIILNGTRFLLAGGTVEFVNPSETEPVVNLAVNTTIQQYSINLRFNGPIEQMRTNYSSDPSLPAADIINLLAFGKTTEAGSSDAATPMSQTAESAIASQVSSQVTSRISKVAGISQLSINPVLAGGTSQGPQGANITIQQRVTGNLFVTFSSNVASTQNQTISGQYQISRRVAVSATRDQNGGFAFDTQIKKSW